MKQQTTFTVFKATKDGQTFSVLASVLTSVHQVIEMVNQYRKDGYQVFSINYSPKKH